LKLLHIKKSLYIGHVLERRLQKWI